MYGTEILEKWVVVCKPNRENEINELLLSEENKFEIRNHQLMLKGEGNAICSLIKKEHTKVVDWDNLRFEHTKILTNKKDETLEVRYAKVRLHSSHKDNPTGYNTTALVFDTLDIEFEVDSMSVYSDGEAVSKFQSYKNIFYLSDGDRKRLETYPIIIYKNGDKTKNGRFVMRFV